MSQLDPLKSFTELTLGKRVDRATANITNGLALFNIEGGRVIMNLIIGEVTTQIETKTVTFYLTSDPDTGTTTELSSSTTPTDLSALEAGGLISITGTATDDTVKANAGSIITQVTPVILAAGAIKAVVGATHTGSIKWSLFYTPIDDGAYVEAA
jgi:hypothetical protein